MLEPILFSLSPGSWFVFVPVNMDDTWIAADRAVFGVFLRFSAGWIDWDDDFFAAGVANVGHFVLHDTEPILTFRFE